MTIFRFSCLLGTCLAVSACDSDSYQDTSACRDNDWNTVCPIDGDRDGAPPTLTAEQQATRAQLCMAEIQTWRDKGVWIHGGVEPAVNRDAWSALSDPEKQQIADIAACIGSAGAFEPREVQIVSEGFKVPIEKLRSENEILADGLGSIE